MGRHDRRFELPENAVERIFSLAPIGMCMVDAQGFIRASNDALQSLVCGRCQSLSGTPLLDFVHRDDIPLLSAVLEEFADGLRTAARLTHRVLRADDSVAHVRLLAVAVEQESNPGGAFCIIDEVENVVRAASDLGRITATDDGDDAPDADAIRSPVHAMVGMSTLLLQTELDHDERRFVETLRQSGDSMLALVDDIVDLGRIKSGTMELIESDFDVEALVEEVAAEHALAADSSVDIVCDVGGLQPPIVHGDGDRVRQVLGNLVSNAVRFTASGHVRIGATTRSDGAAVDLTLTVEDTGCGMPNGEIDTLFSTLVQRQPSGGIREGTGMGLRISRGLVELMGGRSEGLSTVGRGSIFTFTVPMSAAASPPRPMPRHNLASRRVLVVARSEPMRDTLARTLAEVGCAVSVCATAKDALGSVLQARAFDVAFDLVLVGDRLQDAPGDALARVLRADGAFMSTSVIKIGHAQLDVDVARLKRIGYDACMRQPVRRRQLISVLSDLVSRHKSRRVAPIAPPPRRAAVSLAKPPRVLVIDSSDIARTVTGRALEQLGCQVTLAPSGEGAAEKVASGAYDLVLVDRGVPGSEGLTAVSGASKKRGASGMHVPVVALESADDAPARKRRRVRKETPLEGIIDRLMATALERDQPSL